MSNFELFISLGVITLTWLGAIYFLLYTFLSQKDTPNGLTRYEKFWRNMNKRKKPQRLCGYHLTLEFRSSSLALVDGKNCEICHREALKKGKKKNV